MDIIKTAAGWVIEHDGNPVAGPFKTNADAWKWIDARDRIACDMEDTRRRIGSAFAER